MFRTDTSETALSSRTQLSGYHSCQFSMLRSKKLAVVDASFDVEMEHVIDGASFDVEMEHVIESLQPW